MPDPPFADLVRLTLSADLAALASLLGGPAPPSSPRLRLVARSARVRTSLPPPRPPMPADSTFTLADDVVATFTLELDDRYGNPTGTAPAGAAATSSDPAIVAATVTADGVLEVQAPAGTLGTAQVTVTIPGPAGGPDLIALLNVEVVAGAAAAIGLTPAGTRPKDDPAPPPV
jgi:acyl-coenzyme A thioesterase PaaI-like protein